MFIQQWLLQTLWNSYLVSLALDSGKRKYDHLPGEHFLVELVATVFNWWVQVDHLVCNPQLMDNILVTKGGGGVIYRNIYKKM